MSQIRCNSRGLRSVTVLFLNLALAFAFVSAERILKFDSQTRESDERSSFVLRAASFLWESDQTGYHHVWPVSVLFFFSTFEYNNNNNNSDQDGIIDFPGI